MLVDILESAEFERRGIYVAYEVNNIQYKRAIAYSIKFLFEHDINMKLASKIVKIGKKKTT